MRTALIAGTFDPPTLGHLDLILRASQLSDKLVVAAAIHLRKSATAFFTLEERLAMLQALFVSHPKISVVCFEGLLADCAKAQGASLLIRGLRSCEDLDHECQMAVANRKLGGLETLFLPADERYAHISSTLIREIAYFGGNLHDFVPKELVERVRRRGEEKRDSSKHEPARE